jgi:hypothetical protein
MPEFYVTFGQKYRREPHPKGGHPDGWFMLIADSKDEAHAIVTREIGDQWSGLYSEREFDRSFYPRGEIGRIGKLLGLILRP